MNLANVIQEEEYKEAYQPPMFEVIDIAIEQNILAGSGNSNSPDFYGEDW